METRTKWPCPRLPDTTNLPAVRRGSMPVRRASLNIARAAARIRSDAWDDLWPSATTLVDLPATRSEINAARRRVGLLRRTELVPSARVGLVPKANGLMRPAHLLTLDARLYYQALVDSFLHDLDKAVGHPAHVFGYRSLEGRTSKRPFGYGLAQWKRFRGELRRQVASGKYGAMVRTDLAAFFEMIPHGALEERLTSLGVRPAIASELRTVLKRLMGRASGLPQGPDPSGVLASVYLYPMDQALLSEGYGYVRYVDDIVIFAASEPVAKRGLRLLEEEARRLGLIVQSAKTELFVGSKEMAAAVDGDDEIAGIDYIVRKARRSRASATVHAAWLSFSRRNSQSTRYLKYLLNRLGDARDDVAVKWCLKRLGTLDHMAPTIARYLSPHCSRPSVQAAIATHLTSAANISEWEEMNLLRAVLSSRHVARPVLDRSRSVANNRNAGAEVRTYALVLLGRAGDASDHALVERIGLENHLTGTASVIALQEADARTRGRAYAAITSKHPELKLLVSKLSGRRAPIWPTF